MDKLLNLEGLTKHALVRRQATAMDTRETTSLHEEIDTALVRLLEHRYGDGLIYLRDNGERRVYERAIKMGLVSREGYLTPEGRSLLARYYDE